MIRLIIWRHGRTAWNADGRVQGRLDIDLDDVGLSQVEGSALGVAAYHPRLIVSSDQVRAARTAQALAAVTDVPVELDQRLRERDYGPWQGLTHPEIKERYPADYERWGTGEPLAEPAIETLSDLGKRVAAALLDAAGRLFDGECAVVVTHGGSARAGCADLLGWPAERSYGLGPLSNCHVSELRRTPERGWQLRAHNLRPGS